MQKKLKKYTTDTSAFIKNKHYDILAKDTFDKMKQEMERQGGKKNIKHYIKTLFKRFHQGETGAVLIVSTFIILLSSVWAYDNVHRQGIGPSVYDTNKEHVEEMKRAKEVYNWD